MRLIRGLGALLVLVVAVVGVPFALVLLGGLSLPSSLSWSSVRQALLRPDDGTIVIGLVTAIAWAAWALFAFSVLAELAVLVSRRRVRLSLPGLDGPRRLAAGLLLAVVAMASTSVSLAGAAPVTASPVGMAAPDAGPAAGGHESRAPDVGRAAATPRAPDPKPAQPAAVPDPASAGAAMTEVVAAGAPSPEHAVHLVRPGDDLWSLAEHYYGEGRDWRRIAAANPGQLTGGPDRLLPGWRLRIPGVTTGNSAAPARPGSTLVVRPGDSLSSLAEQVYGDADQWPGIFQANRSVVTDPDDIQVGTRLTVPRAPADTTRATERPARPAPDVEPDTDSSGPVPRTEGQSDPHHRTGRPAPTTPTDRSESRAGQTQPGTRLPSSDPRPTSASGSDASAHTSSPSASARPDGSASPTAPASPAAPGSRTASASVTPAEASSAEASSAAPPGALGGDESGPDAGGQLAPDVGEILLGVGAVGGLLAAAVLGGLSLRRRTQLQARPVGRRILHAPPAVQAVETALGRVQQPLGLHTLDLATRAVSVHCRASGVTAPQLASARVGPRQVELVLTGPLPEPPVGFSVSGDSWCLREPDVHYLASVPGVEQAPRPYPALVTLGRNATGEELVVDLESLGMVAVTGADPEAVASVLAALAAQLAFGPGASELTVTVVGSFDDLPDALGSPNVRQSDDVDGLLERLEQRAAVQRRHLGDGVLSNRLDPDLADSWAPEVVLVGATLAPEQERRLVTIVTGTPRVPVAAVLASPTEPAPWTLELDPDAAAPDAAAPDAAAPGAAGLPGGPHDVGLEPAARASERADSDRLDGRLDNSSGTGRRSVDPSGTGRRSVDPSGTGRSVDPCGTGRRSVDASGTGRRSAAPVAVLQPLGLRLEPQLLEAPAHRALVELVSTTGSTETTPAPWWNDGEQPTAGPPPDNVTYLGRRFGGWGSGGGTETDDRDAGESMMVTQSSPPDATPPHPVLRILGPVELVGARGTHPPRAAKQCLEYCGWLLEHPGTSAQAMASALVVAEGTRRSNMSRLRTWLGADGDAQPYLPDAYTGRIVLHPSVSSDWQRLQILTAAGINRTSTGGLRAALELVRGAPLADAAPGQWHWAEELRTDMISAVRDIGVEVCRRALLEHDIDLARWAGARALVAAPGDELLVAARIRTEHQAGNVAETERLTLQLAGHARSLGVDLDAETVVLLQE